MFLPAVTFATSQRKTLLVKPDAARCANTHETTVYCHVSHRASDTEGALVLFCFCSRFWKKCVCTADGPCQGPLDDAWSCTAPPRCLASFMNRLSSLFGALLVWHHVVGVHQGT